MAKTSTLTITIVESGDGQSSSIGVSPQTSLANVNPTAPGGLGVPLILSSGDNTVAIPAGSQGGNGSLMLQGPVGNVVVLKIKGIGGDTGVVIDSVRPFVWSIPTGPTSIIINAGSLVTVTVSWC